LNGKLTHSEEHTTNWNGYIKDTDGEYGEVLQIKEMRIVQDGEDRSNLDSRVMVAKLGLNGTTIELE